ncbi:peptidoglycan-binding protein LysM [Jejudonia soesokkakensis]|uniref:Peptidoglycan-binding protein LysM n=1 Tax=Jejudonia soesokkakensis TaxID=1323432 RepID=A0ABW2MXV5_9FLAO
MGLFTFIKDAGAKIFGGKTSKEKAAEVKAKDAAREAAEDREAEQQLRATLMRLDLEVENLGITIKDDMAKVTGKVASQEIREKVILVIGNSAGIATVDDDLEVEKKAPEAIFHTVENGDTLSKIAKKVYGNAMKYPVIFEANKPMLSDPDKIYPGQVLRIPNLD